MEATGTEIDVDALLRLRYAVSSSRTGRKPPRSVAPGAVLHRQRGRGLEIYDIRSWSDGDDIRHLDRNVTARTGAPHVRTFRDERERSAMLVVDFRDSMMFGTRRAFRSVVAAEAIAAMAWRVIEQGGRIAILAATPLGARFIGRARGVAATTSLIGELALTHRAIAAQPKRPDPPLAEILIEAEGRAKDAAIFVATALDAPGDNFDGAAERLARKCDLRVALVVDRFETAPPAGVYPFQTDEGDAGVLHVARDGKEARDSRPTRLRRLGVNFMQIDSGMSGENLASALEQLDG